MKPVNVLYVYGDRLHHGGIENFMMNYFRHINRNIVHIDFVVQGKTPGVYDSEIENAGSCIYRLPKPSQNPFRYNREIIKILKTGKYKIIHAHCDAMNFRVLRLAEKCNIPVRISHSHNTQHILTGKAKFKLFFYEYSRKRVANYASVCYACSKEAGRWMYGEHYFMVVPNAIDIDNFLFCREKREELRRKFNIAEEDIVLGHVGRFDVQKNQAFLIRLLQELLKEGCTKYLLLLVGDGWMKKDIEKMAYDLHLEKHVIFTGEVDNPQDYYNMMDIFLMPSLFEGYGMALEEAEVNGLPCLASEYIPQEADVLKHIDYISLNLNIWRKKILNLFPVKRYTDAAAELRRKGYDIQEAAKKLQNEYVRLYQESVVDKKCVKYQ